MKDVEIIKARNVLSSRARTNLAKRLRVAAYCRVSTDSEDQLNSYKSQVQHYTDLIKSKSEWDLAGIYADEAITGTQVTKREDFQRLINDCMNGDVDMIITKSISRFARNTLDTLKYVRMLKEKGIAVFFEEENINTLTMDGELLLVILSSVAQQEVENISANVKKGLKMKMQRGELVGFQGCLGYDYHPEDKSISINEEEAEIVRYIFRRYIEGAGGSVIAQELENLGYKTKRGSTRWAETTVIGIIKNEKYKGDILMGKTFTLDPISKRRLDNFGEEDQFYIRDHHEAIISEEMFEKAQEILKRRAKPRRLGTDGKREKFSRKYAFSCMLECGFCGGTLTRRSWHSGSQYNKVIWQCVTATKKGKKFCPDSKGIAEETIEQAFIESYRLLCQNNKDVLDEFIARTEETLSDSNASKQLAKVEKDIAALDAKRAKLVDMRLEEIIDKETYEQKYFDLSSQIEQLQKQRESLQESAETESTMKKRIAEFRRTLEENEVLDTFDRYVFESIVEKVIVGGYDEDGNKDPAMLTFIYKTGFKNSLDGTNFKPPRKNSKAAKQNAGLCSHTTDEAKSMCSYHSDDTDGWMEIDSKIAQIYMRTLAEYSIKCSGKDIVLGTDTSTHSREIYNNSRNRADLQAQCCKINIENCLPQPSMDVSFEDILEFKNRRKDELNAFRAKIRELETNIYNAYSPELIRHYEAQFIEGWQQCSDDFYKVLKESRITFFLSSFVSLVAIPFVGQLLSPHIGQELTSAIQAGAPLLNIGIGYFDYRNKISPAKADGGFSYIIKANRDGIIHI